MVETNSFVMGGERRAIKEDKKRIIHQVWRTKEYNVMETKRIARKKKHVLSSGKSHKAVRRMNTEERLDLIN